MSGRRSAWLLAVAVVVSSGATRVARAQPATNAIAAEELFRQGRELLEQKHFAEACEKLEASQKLDSAVGTLFSLGECYAAQGRDASAWFAFRGAAALAAARGDHRRVGAQMKADALEPELAHLVIHMSDRREDVRVSVDGGLLAAAALDSPLPVDPGPHKVEARGLQSYEVTVQVSTNGVTKEVSIPSLVPPTPPTSWHAAPTWRRVAGLGLVGVGSGVAVAGAVLGLQAIVKARDVRAACGDAPTCADQTAVHESGQGGTYADLSTVLVPVGLAVAAAGLVVVATTHGSFGPVVGPGNARLDAKWTW
jgi:hypothetical protein